MTKIVFYYQRKRCSLFTSLCWSLCSCAWWGLIFLCCFGREFTLCESIIHKGHLKVENKSAYKAITTSYCCFSSKMVERERIIFFGHVRTFLLPSAVFSSPRQKWQGYREEFLSVISRLQLQITYHYLEICSLSYILISW